MVSGGAALLLEGGVLTARQVKIALQLSAGFMKDEGVLRAGLGRVNLYSARRVNSALTALTGVIPPVTIAGRTVLPGGLMLDNGQPLVDGATAPVGTTAVSSLGMLSTWLGVVLKPARITALRGSQMLWGDQIPALQMLWGDLTPLGQQMLWGDQSVAQQMLWGDHTFGQQMLWGDHTFDQQMLWGDQTLGQQMLWGDQTLGQQMLWGDQTTGQQMLWGDAKYTDGNQMLWGDSIRPDGQ
jgi:hypothetical protein